jgi:hypothetical protein
LSVLIFLGEKVPRFGFVFEKMDGSAYGEMGCELLESKTMPDVSISSLKDESGFYMF